MAKILVIDDDPLIVELLKMRLTDAGHQVSVAMDANGGMMVAAREKPELITLDYQMPAGDGAKMLQRLRGNTFTASTPVIFVTGKSSDDLDQSLMNAPRVRFLQKPIEMDVLNRLIAELLGQAPPAPAAPPAAPKPPVDDGGAFGGDILDLKL
jgi:DNA-binding response OmpR family regulator